MRNHFKPKCAVALITLSAILGGCSTNPFTSQARVFNEQLNNAVAYSKKCTESNANNPDVIQTYEQIMVKGLNPPNRSELLASDKKLNDQQRVAFQNYLKLDGVCNDGTMAALQGSPYANLLQSSEAISAVNDSNLLNGKITIGEANAKKIDIAQKLLTDITLLRQQINNQYLHEQNSSSAAAQNAINDMNTATKIRQSQTTQQILQQQNQNRFLGR